MKLEEHLTVRRLLAAGEANQAAAVKPEGAWLRQLALDCGAHDVGLAEFARPGLASQRDEILRNYPWETLSYAVLWLSGLIGIGLCFR